MIEGNKILLIEPGYRNKYPPLGLMKIASYHKLRGDYTYFAKGCHKHLPNTRWDRVYISTLFTFHWKITLDTIRFYTLAVNSPQDIIVGGVLATLFSDELRNELGVRVIPGLLDRPGILDDGDKRIIDTLVPDYSMLNDTDYKYGLQDAYFGYATRGCPNRCKFCAVHHIEPTFVHYLPLKRQVQKIESIYGAKQNLVLMDNNVLASSRFDDIIRDILDLGFEKGAKYRNRLRFVDFNQGLDMRLLTKTKAKLLAQTAISPVRLAFDSLKLKTQYSEKVKLLCSVGLPEISTYVLFNYNDTPTDFYERLRTNVELNACFGSKIYAFPMRYIPLDGKERSHVGKNWTWRLLRGVQCMLLATHGLVSPHLEFFEAQFGRTPEEFLELALMPEDYIIHRNFHFNNNAKKWKKVFRSLSPNDRNRFYNIISERPTKSFPTEENLSRSIKNLLSHYLIQKKCD